MNDDFSSNAYGQRYPRGGSTGFAPPPPNPALSPSQSQNMATSKVFGKPTNTTRVLLLQGFAPELKTRDLLAVFQEWEDQGEGFRVKWIDDQSAYIVFFDPNTAKKAFLATVSNLPPSLAPSLSSPGAKLTPYSGSDAQEIIETAAKRPRSRSNAGHQRNFSGSYGIQNAINPPNTHGGYMNGSSGGGGGSVDYTTGLLGGRHGRSDSLGTRFAFPPAASQSNGVTSNNSSPEDAPRHQHHRSGSTGSMIGSSPVSKAEREAAVKHMTQVLQRS